MDVRELERKVKLTQEEAEALFDHHDALLRAAVKPKDQMKALKSVAHAAVRAVEAGSRDLARLERFAAVLDEAVKLHDLPAEISRGAANVRKALTAARGGTEVRIVSTAKGSLSVEGGVIALGDANAAKRFAREEPVAEHMAAGLSAYVGTGGDGRFSTSVREVTGGEPMLTDDEMARIDAASSVVVIDVPSGTLGCFAPGDETPVAKIAVAPGRYAVRCFRTKKKYAWVATASAQPLGTAPRSIEVLEAD